MSSAARINVLVTGYGNIGTPILRALTTSEYSDRIAAFVLVRPASLSDPSKKAALDEVRALKGVTLVEGDLEAGVPALTALLKRAAIHTVVAVVGGLQVPLQLPLVEAAKAAGVRHFIPSEFGVDTEATPIDGLWGPFLRERRAVQQAVKTAGLDYSLLYVGLFTEFLVGYTIAGVDLQRGVVAAPGSWQARVNSTTLDETAWLVAAAVVDPQARNAALYTGETVTYQQVADLVDAARGKPVERRIRSVEEAQKAVQDNTNDFAARLVGVLADGRGAWWPATNNYAAKYHPDHKPRTVADWISANVKLAEQ